MVGSVSGISGISTMDYKWARGTAGTSGKSRPQGLGSAFATLSSQTLDAARTELGSQNTLARFNQLPEGIKSELVYEGRPISEFSPQEAADLISEDGYFGVAKTSARISGFVMNLAGDDPEKLRIGRQAVIQGFEAAEKLWGEKLPEICYETLNKTLAAIDDKIFDAGGSVVDFTA